MTHSAPSYHLGFTAFGLGASPALALATVFLEFSDWDRAKEQVIERNVFRQTKATSIRRFERESLLRLQTLRDDQLALLVSHPAGARVPLALLVAFKRYGPIRDFSVEVLTEGGALSILSFIRRTSSSTSIATTKTPSSKPTTKNPAKLLPLAPIAGPATQEKG